jgi:ParB/RepB/Spo0J family partition protein
MVDILEQLNQAGVAAGLAARYLPVADIRPDPAQPRQTSASSDTYAEALEDLTASVRVHGVLEPILVTRDPDNAHAYLIVAGERRWRAATNAGLAEVPAIVRDDMDDNQRFVVQVVENIQRLDMSDLDTAQAIRRLVEFGMTKSQVAEQFGKSPAYVTRMLSYLTGWEDESTRALVERMTPQTWLLMSTKSSEIQQRAVELAEIEGGVDADVYRRHIDAAVREAEAREAGESTDDAEDDDYDLSVAHPATADAHDDSTEAPVYTADEDDLDGDVFADADDDGYAPPALDDALHGDYTPPSLDTPTPSAPYADGDDDEDAWLNDLSDAVDSGTVEPTEENFDLAFETPSPQANADDSASISDSGDLGNAEFARAVDDMEDEGALGLGSVAVERASAENLLASDGVSRAQIQEMDDHDLTREVQKLLSRKYGLLFSTMQDFDF